MKNLGVGDEQVVANDLDALAEFFGKQLPTVPVVFGHAVFDGDDRVAIDQVSVKIDQFSRALFRLGFVFEQVLAVLKEFGGRYIES